jgi:hypothetical protein
MRALKIKKTAADTIQLIGASVVLFLLFSLIIARHDPDWLGFWLATAAIVASCFIANRFLNRMPDTLFKQRPGP